MRQYRGELRVFGLLTIALVVSATIYGGLSTATVDGKALGLEFTVGGPAAFFILLVAVFAHQRLLSFEVVAQRTDHLISPVEDLSLEEAQAAIDQLGVDAKRIRRRQDLLRKYVAELAAGKGSDEAMSAMGMRAVRRPSR